MNLGPSLLLRSRRALISLPPARWTHQFGILKIYQVEPVDPVAATMESPPAREGDGEIGFHGDGNKVRGQHPLILSGDTLTDPQKKIQFFDNIVGSATIFVKKKHLHHFQDLPPPTRMDSSPLLSDGSEPSPPPQPDTIQQALLTATPKDLDSSLSLQETGSLPARLDAFPTLPLTELVQLTKASRDSSKRLEAPALPTKRELSLADSEFLEAVLFGDEAKVLGFLDKVDGEERARLLSLNHPAHGGTALHIACSNGYVGLVDHLLHLGARVNARAFNGSTPLHWAMKHDAPEDGSRVVSLLLSHGADVQASTYTWRSTVHGTASGQTPAHWASDFGNHHLLDVLLEHTAEAIEAKDDRSQTPLALVSKKGDRDTQNYLLQKRNEKYVCLRIKVVQVAARALSRQGNGST